MTEPNTKGAVMAVDVDSHFFEPFDWLHRADARLADDLYKSLPAFSPVDFFLGEVLAGLPPEYRAEVTRALPFDFLGTDQSLLTMEETEARLSEFPQVQGVLNAKGARGGGERNAACEEQGIDLQIINPTFALFDYLRVLRHRPAQLAELCVNYNRWTLQALDGQTNRLKPTVLLDISDPAGAVRELTAMRASGARSWIVPLEPVNGKPLSHPDLDPLWAASADLGILPILHVGLGSVALNPSWFNTGRPDPGVTVFRLGITLATQVAELALADLLFNGVFERHPDLVVLCSEFGLSWLQSFWERIGPTHTRGLNMQNLIPWPSALSPQDYIRRNVRFSPLPGDPVERFIADFGPDMLWFASDYPHPEGSAKAVELFGEDLEALDESSRQRFFSGGASEFLARTA